MVRGMQTSAAGDGDGRPLGPFGSLTELVIRRLFLSDLVAAAKFGTGRPINDPERERNELNRVRLDATSRGIDHERAVAFFRDQMAASKVIQEGMFQRWTADPRRAPTARPDLGRIRLQLDDITTGIMELLATRRALRLAPSLLRAVREPDAPVDDGALNRLDGLHRSALSLALRSLDWLAETDEVGKIESSFGVMRRARRPG
jgi:chorismate mutase